MIEKNPGITIYKATDKSVNVVFNSEISKKIENSVIFDCALGWRCASGFSTTITSPGFAISPVTINGNI